MKVSFRADASVQIGSGHVMRCLTLADSLRGKGAEASFVCRDHEGNLCGLIEERGFPVIRLPAGKADTWLGEDQETDARQTMAALEELGKPDWLVVDHYSIDSKWESELRKMAGRIMVIDDLANRPHDCDLILDQNLYAGMDNRYEGLVSEKCVVFLGPKYALLRPEFAKARENMRERDGLIRRIFIFFGGSDLTNETAKAIEAVGMLNRPEIAVDVVIGATNPNQSEIQALCDAMPHARLHVQASNMAELMSEADLSIGAGGGTTWERCCLGLPTITVSLAANQCSGSEALALKGAAIYLGRAAEIDAPLIRSALETSFASRNLLLSCINAMDTLVDGKGAERIVDHFMAKSLDLRRAGPDDCEGIYRWRNAVETRRFSGDPEPITYETHVAWYRKMLSDQNHEILIGELDGIPVGVIRFDRENEHATVSVYLIPGNEGRGLGKRLIHQGTCWIAEHWSIKVIVAEIHPENVASVAAFEAVGFRKKKCIYSKHLRK